MSVLGVEALSLQLGFICLYSVAINDVIVASSLDHECLGAQLAILEVVLETESVDNASVLPLHGAVIDELLDVREATVVHCVLIGAWYNGCRSRNPVKLKQGSCNDCHLLVGAQLTLYIAG